MSTMWPAEEQGKVGIFSKNIQQAKGSAQYYLTEVEGLFGKNWKRILTIKDVWVCRYLACICLYILLWSFPVCFYLAVILWIFSGKVEIINYLIGLKPEVTNTLIDPNQRKTILLRIKL